MFVFNVNKNIYLNNIFNIHLCTSFAKNTLRVQKILALISITLYNYQILSRMVNIYYADYTTKAGFA